MSRLLLTGASGQVGWELRRSLLPLGEVVAPSRAELDLEDPAALKRAVRDVRPIAVFNAAAYTAVDDAEDDAGRAEAINAAAPAALAEAVRRLDALLVHFSTDYVFDGRSKRPYLESDPTAPLGVYGRTKLDGERAVAASGCRHVTIRSSWVYASRGRNFLRTVLRLASEKETLRIVSDQVGSPTWARALAAAAVQIAGRLLPAPGRTLDDSPPPYGTYHLACSGSTSWHGFATAILERAARDPDLASRLRAGPSSVEAIASADYPTPARRPAYSVLDCRRARRVFGVTLPPWETALDLCLEEWGTFPDFSPGQRNVRRRQSRPRRSRR